MKETTEAIIAACSGLLLIFTLIGLAVRLVLLPYLRDHLVTPVAEVRDQVKNTHETNLREDIDLLGKAVERSDRKQEQRWQQARREDAQRWREHLSYSASIAERVERLERRQRPDDN